MKIRDIEVGPVYWYDTQQNWGPYLGAAYNRFAAERIDDKRYNLTGSSWSVHRNGVESAAGKYVAVREVGILEDGTIKRDPEGRVRFVLATHIRDTYDAVKARYEARRKADREADERRQVKADSAVKVADELSTRLEKLGVTGIVVGSTTGVGYQEGAPKTTVVFDKGYGRIDPVETLTAILDRLERAEALAASARDWRNGAISENALIRLVDADTGRQD